MSNKSVCQSRAQAKLSGLGYNEGQIWTSIGLCAHGCKKSFLRRRMTMEVNDFLGDQSWIISWCPTAQVSLHICSFWMQIYMLDFWVWVSTVSFSSSAPTPNSLTHQATLKNSWLQYLEANHQTICWSALKHRRDSLSYVLTRQRSLGPTAVEVRGKFLGNSVIFGHKAAFIEMNEALPPRLSSDFPKSTLNLLYWLNKMTFKCKQQEELYIDIAHCSVVCVNRKKWQNSKRRRGFTSLWIQSWRNFKMQTYGAIQLIASYPTAPSSL